MNKIKLAMLLIFASATTSAFVLAPHTWTPAEFTMHTGDLCSTGPGNCSGGGGNPNWVNAFDVARARWNDATALFTVNTGTQSTAQPCEFTSIDNVIFSALFCGDPYGAQTLAISGTWFDQNDNAVQTHIGFNTAFTWGTFDGPATNTQDFRRVAVHEVGHSLGLDHSADTTAIMFFQASNTIAPQADDLAGVAAKYGNGITVPSTAPEIVALQDVDSDGVDELAAVIEDAGDGSPQLLIRNAMSGAAVGSAGMTVGSVAVAMARTPDVNGNQTEDVAILLAHADSTYSVELRDGGDASLIRSIGYAPAYEPKAMSVIDDIDGLGTIAIAVLGVHADGSVRAQIKSSGGSQIRNIQYAASLIPRAMAVVSDVTGNTFPELIVLGVSATGDVRVQVKDAGTGDLLHWIQFGKSFSPLAMAVVPDSDGASAPAVAILGEHADGRVSAQVKNVLTKAQLHAGRVNFANRYVFRKFTVVADQSGNGVSELAYLGVEADGSVRAQYRDPVNKTLTNSTFFSASYPPEGVTLFDGLNGNGTEEFAVVGIHNNGNVRAQIKDAVTNESLSTVLLP